jgi:hypothetical protein
MKNFKKASSVYSFLALFSFVLLLISCSITIMILNYLPFLD